MTLKYYLVVNGTAYDISNGSTYGIVDVDGLGLSPVAHNIESGPMQHGATHTGFRLQPRRIPLVIDLMADDLDEHFERREELLTILAYRSLPASLRVVYGSNIRQIDGYVSSGLTYGSGGMIGFHQVAGLELLCPDPTFYDPTRVFTSISASGGGTAFPVPTTFPTTFGASAIEAIQEVNYYGTWEEYPVIEIIGPIDSPTITNLDTGETLEISEEIDADAKYVIDCRYGYKTVEEYDITDPLNPEFVANRIDKLTSDSDLATFHLAPRQPGETYHVNSIQVSGLAISSATKFYIRYYNRYIGI